MVLNNFKPKTTPVFDWNYHAKERVIINQGGTSSGKTFSIMQVIAMRAVQNPHTVTTVAAETIPALKAGALRDFQKYFLGEIETNPNLKGWEFLLPHFKNYNKSDRVYTLPNGSVIEFKSYETPESAKLGKRHYLFLNEANHLPFETYTNLAIRTSKQIFLDYNPTSKFWVHEKLLNTEGVRLFISCYKHNPFLSDLVRADIEAAKILNPSWYAVYGLGLTGKIEGLVFQNTNRAYTFPLDAQKVFYGLDFGFTNDPTSLVKFGINGGQIFAEELIYERRMTNVDISERLNVLGIPKNATIVADSAEPKSIAELEKLGHNIIAATKGADSIRQGIDLLKRYQINVIGVNLWKEVEKYAYVKKGEETLNEPIDKNNHAIDALRYAATYALSDNIHARKALDYETY